MKLGVSKSPVQSDVAVNIHPSRARAARLGRRVSQFAHVDLLEVWLNASHFQQSLCAQLLRSAELFNEVALVEDRPRRVRRGWCERVDTKNAFDELVCAAEESGDNGFIELDEDVKEQTLDGIKDGLGADCEAAIMQRQVPAVRWIGANRARTSSRFHRCRGMVADVFLTVQRQVQRGASDQFIDSVYGDCWRL